MTHLPTNFVSDHYVVLLTPVILDINDDLAKRYDAGIYEFSSFKKARKFATACNRLFDGEKMAHRFARNNIKEENND